jgi:hypothetical protein
MPTRARENHDNIKTNIKIAKHEETIDNVATCEYIILGSSG